MPFRPALLLLALVLAGPAWAQQQVARVKSAPQDYRGRPIEVQGEVVEVQALSPRSRQGVYRLVDGTDPAGILIRTNDLPRTGGPFRVRAALAPELLLHGQVLLDEADRNALGTSRLPFALGLGGLGLLVLGAAAGLYYRARAAERRMHLAPPLWLIPAGTEPEPGAQTAPSQRFDYKLQYVAEERSATIDARKRRALMAIVPGLLMTVAGSVWAAAAWQAESSQPAFVLLEPSEPGQSPSPPAGSDTMAAQTGAPRPDDTLRVALAPAPVAPAPPPDSLRRRRPRRDTAAAAVPAVTAPRRDTATAASAPVQVQVAAPVQPPPPPAPQPEPERREPAAAAVPDEAALRRAADAELQRGIARFVAAVTARQVGTVATLYPAGGDNRRIKFLDYLRESEPEVSLRMTEAAAVSETSAQANFTLTFRWRAEFGVARRKDARFVATARRTGDGWAFESARLLENMP